MNRLIVLLTVILAITGSLISCASTDVSKDIVNSGESTPLVSETRWEYSENDAQYFVYYIELDKDGNAIWYDTGNNIVLHLSAESI